MSSYIVVGTKPWNSRIFHEVIQRYSGDWTFINDKENFSPELVAEINPRYIFFLHWSWLVPTEIIDNYECVCFHMTDVPYGRGGSPLQNLIVRGHRETQLTALKMVHDFDAGPVYLKKSLSLEGGAEEIYIRATYLSAKMIKQIIEKQPHPVQQIGEVTIFKRRKPVASEIPTLNSLPGLHDFIRMLDADGYPKAFLYHNGFKYEFSRAVLYDGQIVADVKITPIEDGIT